MAPNATFDLNKPELRCTLVLGLWCSWCPGSAPMPKLLGLYALPPVVGAAGSRLAQFIPGIPSSRNATGGADSRFTTEPNG
jgi:hypothetical protein